MMKYLILILFVLLLLSGCGESSYIETYEAEHPVRTYEITMPNYTTTIVKARECEAHLQKGKWGNNSTPILEIICTNTGRFYEPVYSSIALSMRLVE